MRFCALFLGVGLLAGCAATTSNPGNSAALPALEIALTTAEKAATVYVSLPLCPVNDGTLCSKTAISAQIKSADQAAYLSVVAARTGGSLAVAQAAIATLNAAIPAK